MLKTLSICALILAASIANGQNYPNRHIRIIAPEVGGGADAAVRLLAQQLSVGFGQSIIIENRGAT